MTKMLSLVLYVLGAVVCVAQDKTITIKPGQGLSQALVAGGCNVLWISQVMADNDVGPEKLRDLPAGAVFTVPEGCETVPAPNIAKLSQLIMGADRKFGRPISADEGKRLKSDIESLIQSRTNLRARVDSLNEQVTDLTEQLKKANERKVAGSRNIPLVVFAFFTSVLAGCLAVGLYLSNLRLIAETKESGETISDKNRRVSELEKLLGAAQQNSPPVIQYELGGGVTATFMRVPDAEEALLHTCSLCGPEKPPVERKNVPRHLRRVHNFDVNTGVGVERPGVETVSVM